jgi:hypothetical protein
MVDTPDDDLKKFEEEYEGRFAWRKNRQLFNLKELAEIAQTGGAEALKKLPKLSAALSGDDPKDALGWSILMLWAEATECYVFGEFQSCILACGAVVERCLKLEFERASGKMTGQRWTLGVCIGKCTGIVSAEVLDLARQILEPRNSRAHALLEHTDPVMSKIGGLNRGIERLSNHHHLIEFYRGDATSVIQTTYQILEKLYA